MSDREFDSLSDTVEFFDLRIFYLGELLRITRKLLLANFVKVTVSPFKIMSASVLNLTQFSTTLGGTTLCTVVPA